MLCGRCALACCVARASCGRRSTAAFRSSCHGPHTCPRWLPRCPTHAHTSRMCSEPHRCASASGCNATRTRSCAKRHSTVRQHISGGPGRAAPQPVAHECLELAHQHRPRALVVEHRMHPPHRRVAHRRLVHAARPRHQSLSALAQRAWAALSDVTMARVSSAVAVAAAMKRRKAVPAYHDDLHGLV